MFFKRIHYLLISISCVFLFGCSSLLYYPQKQQLMNPLRWGLEPEDVFFTNQDGLRLHGWWFAAQTIQGERKTALGTVVFFHGNGENLSSHFAMLAWLPAAGYNYFIFDYPGYGLSDGEPSPEKNVQSGVQALLWVTKNKDSRPLIVYGHSIGGVTALRSVEEVISSDGVTADLVPIAGVIAEGTFLSYQSIAREKMSENWVTWLLQPLAYVLLSDKYAPKHVEKISPRHLLVIHGTTDPVIPFAFGQEIYQQAADPKNFVKVDGGHHGDLYLVDEHKYRQIVLDQVATWLKK